MAYATGYYRSARGRYTKVHIVSSKKGGPICGSNVVPTQFFWIGNNIVTTLDDRTALHFGRCTRCFEMASSITIQQEIRND